ncbi:MAG: Holliday junction branch migration protein RuvA [Caldicoprobacter oshimai]|uniref:Holliday junction branch migration complex subunit RuvA n=1 Tax=Caldicoprobacter faecalis TaxID=937334 RepID=A0A1I5VJ92_9FIRM|nr:Holliday junction branch migration protein RuvA [Caldicoprobacter faecalis]PZN11829.1 MAG: Holliday junction branch migration protein RuvA [Caldicoprobacter oshimai]SFQ07367.1 Holliday junction DNA helicase subunit RuvA [Caldicoprobacter faecalis]
MFAYLKGMLVEVGPQHVVLDVQGVGFYIIVPSSVVSKLPSRGNDVKLYVHLNVRQDGMELYGFLNREDKLLFEKLISVSGIGPKAAISMLSTLSSTQLALAIATGDVKALSAAPGIGKKTAQRVILELREKIDKEVVESSPMVADEVVAAQGIEKEALQALMALGYQAFEAQRAVDLVKDQAQDTATLVKLALKALDRR